MKVFCHIRVKIYLLYFFCVLSLNGVCQWQKIEEPYGGYVNNIAQVDNLMFAGAHFYSSELPGFWHNTMHLTHDGKDFFIISESKGIYLSVDNGVNWQKVNDSTLMYLYSVAAGPGCIFISTRDGGVIRSTDKGYTWKRYNEGFPGYATSVTGLALSGDTLYAVGLTDYSTGMGIYKRSSFPAGITPLEKHENGMRIHPNPVAGSFTISIRDQMLSNIPFSIISNIWKKDV